VTPPPAQCNPAAVDLAGRSVVIAGRLESLERSRAIALVKDRGGTVRRGLSRRTGCLVVGHNAADLVASGRLQSHLEAADRADVPCFSERGFLRLLKGDVPPPTGASRAEAAPFTAAEIARTAGLSGHILRILALLDIIELDEGRGGFSALAAARQAGRLLRAGSSLTELIAAVSEVRYRGRLDPIDPLARHRFDLDERRRLVLRLGERLAEADGQMRLNLPDAGNPSLAQLMERAQRADSLGDWATAEAVYRRCVSLDRHDPIAPFNLANVLREQGRVREAALFLRLALARDHGFAEAWYNLGHMAEAAGDGELARHSLERALQCDPEFADACFNLARLHYAAGAYAQAEAEWRHYLELDADSAWARKARHGIALCRQYLRRG
jgi:tetratricopeptide (TPR) repeat protein